MTGRKTPYTRIGLKRLSCVRCGDPAARQVVFPVDGLWKPLCVRCDEELQLIFLVYLGDPDIDSKIERYRDTCATRNG